MLFRLRQRRHPGCYYYAPQLCLDNVIQSFQSIGNELFTFERYHSNCATSTAWCSTDEKQMGTTSLAIQPVIQLW